MEKTILNTWDTELHFEDEGGSHPPANSKHPSFAVRWKYTFNHFANGDKPFLADHYFFSLETKP